MVAQEYTIWVEHWDNLEDKVLAEAASDVMRRHKKVNEALQNYFHPDCENCKTIFILIVKIAKLDLDNKRGGGLSRMNPRHDEHYFHLFKNYNRLTMYTVHCIVIYLNFFGK